ncbi:NACHT domain-containing NTPase [Enterobacter sp. CC120223-11]|uniref:NACHT domain-containing protein n=1 Tax=Enterobacter sp. CC120223-11 TaxID=1378073 RepID=UPI000BDAAD8B|nr:NACHT domain-containing protein [Enterobacter sp. CC120223-11]SNY63930.1 Predicted NTPase (NACHT family) [Enterobacter sp. CC120223-11]
MLSEALITTTVKIIATKLLDAGTGTLKRNGNKILRALKNDKILDKYTKNAVNRVFVFRTLTHGDKNVYLDEVYYPLKLNHSAYKSTIEVKDGTRLPNHSPICIIGIAGQGKTTVMRKLFLEELVEQETLPFFISLRQIKDYENLTCEELLLNHLQANGIKCDLEDVIYLCNSQKISFYFDGFDEIPFTQRTLALETINSAYEKYGCPIIVTTRPETEITRTAGFDTYNVDFLRKKDIDSILRKTVTDKDAYDFIIKLLITKAFLMQSIRTPILLDIFIITSTALREDPNSISDYYDGLFSALLHRHDLIKNLTRTKKSNLSDRILERCFSLFSFFSLMNSKGDFSRSEINDLFAKSASAMKIDKSPEGIADDIIDGTNILVKDGYDNYVYIHKSIQEYFAAKCISTMDDSAKANIYNNFKNMHQHQLSTSLMMMLSYLDGFDFVKLYILKKFQAADCLENELITKLEKKDYINHIGEWVLEINAADKRCSSLTTEHTGPWMQIEHVECIYSYLISDGVRQSLEFAGNEFMLERGDIIAEHVCNGDIKPLPPEHPKVKDTTPEVSENLFIELSSARSIINNYDELFDEPYESYSNSEIFINKYIKENYHDKIESTTILNSMIDNIKFK